MNDPPLFPPHIRSFEVAVGFVVDWVDVIGGDIASDLAVVDTGRTLRVAPTTVTFPGTDTVVTFSFTLDAELVASWYRFDLRRRSGDLLWRHDCHPGHEATLGGPHHLHIGLDEEHRIPAEAGHPRAGGDQGRHHPHPPDRLTSAPALFGGPGLRPFSARVDVGGPS